MLIKAIDQVDSYRFSIVWRDGRKDVFRLADLQKRCPCQKCQDERATHEKKSDSAHELVKAIKILGVGNYALRIFFTSGCSEGIYPFELLRKWGVKHA